MVKRNFKKIIIEELSSAQVQNKFKTLSKLRLLANISENSDIEYSKRLLKKFIKRSLKTLEEEKTVIRKKNSYRLSLKTLYDFFNKLHKHENKGLFTNQNQKNNASKKYKGISSTKKALTSNNNIIPVVNVGNKSAFKDYHKRWVATWQYHDNDNLKALIRSVDGWYDYDAKASDIVEDEWQRYIVNRGMNDVRSVKSGEWEYLVDFINWKQTNIVHQNHKVRPVRRICENGSVTNNPYQ